MMGQGRGNTGAAEPQFRAGIRTGRGFLNRRSVDRTHPGAPETPRFYCGRLVCRCPAVSRAQHTRALHRSAVEVGR